MSFKMPLSFAKHYKNKSCGDLQKYLTKEITDF